MRKAIWFLAGAAAGAAVVGAAVVATARAGPDETLPDDARPRLQSGGGVLPLERLERLRRCLDDLGPDAA